MGKYTTLFEIMLSFTLVKMQLNQLYKLLIKQLTVFGPLGDPGAPAQ